MTEGSFDLSLIGGGGGGEDYRGETNVTSVKPCGRARRH